MSDEKELMIVRGSTPLLAVTLPEDISTSDIATGIISISQRNKGVLISKTLDEMTVDGNKYSVFLKQSETLKLDSTKPAAIQAKFCTIDDIVLVSFIQNIEILPVNNEKLFEQDNPSGDTYEATGESGIEIVPDLVNFTPDIDVEQITISTDDYNLLRNKPSINGVTLSGNKTLDELGVYSSEQVDALLEPIADKEVEQDAKLSTIEAQIGSYTLARNVLANEYTNAEIDEKIAGAGDIHALEERIDNQIGTHTVARNVLANEYTNTEIDSKVSEVSSALNNKVDKVSGKGLSTNDYTTAEKTKLANIEAGAQVNTITGVKGDSEASYRTGNVNITKANIGLGNVDNTSDADKPISTAVQTALDAKQGKLTAGANITIDENNVISSTGGGGGGTGGHTILNENGSAMTARGKLQFMGATVTDDAVADKTVVSGLKGDTGEKGEKGDTGETGNGIASAVLNSNYTLTLNFTDGTSYTTPNPIRGEKGETGDTGPQGIQGVQGEQGPKGDTGDTGPKGDTGNGIRSITKTGTSGLVDTYTVTFTDSTTTTFSVTNGAKGDTGDTGPQGETGPTGATGPKGDTGDTGNGIASAVLNADYTLTLNFTNGTSYTTPTPIRGAQGETGATGATGETGPQGPSGSAATIAVGNVTSGSSASVVNSGTSSAAVFDFVLPKGDKGDTGSAGPTGPTGNGISSITKTGTVGLVDTYTIAFTDGTSTTFTVTNGQDGSSNVQWGDITGTLANQTDLNNALSAKANASNLATIESSTTASQSYSEGDHLVLNGQLYEVTADVASGETLVVGTNITARNVGEELTALNNGLIVQFPSTGWTTTETVNGTTYYTQTVSVTSVSRKPIIGITPITGTLPTSAEQDAFDSVEYFTANDTTNTIKGYATSAPSDTFAVVVKGAR